MENYKSKKVLYDLYIIKQKSAKEIAEQFNVSNVTILNWLKKHNIQTRSQTKKNDFNHYIGNRYGNLTILKILDYHTEPSGHKRKTVEVQCLCGFIYKTKLNYIIRKNGTKTCIKCSKINKRLFQFNQKIDKLTIKDYKNIKNKTFVLVDCDCGAKNILMRPDVIKINKTNNCGCSHRGLWSGVGDISSTFFNKLKKSAKIRKLKFNITHEYLWELFLKQNKKCALSGEDIKFGFLTTEKNTASLDRIDSKKGYVKSNVWWVHKDINLMKMDLSLTRFKELCKKVNEEDEKRF